MKVRNWDDLRYLAAVHRTGSMTGAAGLLNANAATVSRRIARLSQDLGMELFEKRPEGWALNPVAADLVETSVAFENRLETTLNARNTDAEDIVGSIRLAAPPAVNMHVLTPCLDRLHRRAPHLSLSLTHAALISGLSEFDMVISVVRPEIGRVRMRTLGSLAFRIYQSVDSPTTDRWVGLIRTYDEGPASRWAEAQFGTEPLYRVQTYGDVRAIMCRTGLPGPLPEIVARDAPELVPVGGPEAEFRLPIYLSTHETRRDDPVLRSAVDWIVDSFRTMRIPRDGM